MQISSGTGLVPSRVAIASATGATISTVATLSTNAEIKPANTDSATATHMMFGVLRSRRSAIRSGIFEAMNSETVPIVPASIIRMFQSICVSASETGSAPEIIMIAADASATRYRHFGSAIMATYVAAKSKMTNSFMTTTPC